MPTYSLEGLVDELRGLDLPERLSRYEVWDLPPLMQAAIDQYLSNPPCDHMAEAARLRLGVDGTTDWSVGFASAAARILLAAFFARCAPNGLAAAVDQQPERRLIFLGGQELVKSRAQRKPECDLCGSDEIRGRFARRWRGGDAA